MALVYRKTEKGAAEIETRANRLAPRLRATLIMIDGQRSDDELRSLMPAQADSVLSVLLDTGYIEVLGFVPARANGAQNTMRHNRE